MRTRTAGGGSRLQDAAESLDAAFAGFDPENVRELREVFDGLPAFFSTLAGGVSALAGKLDDGLPVHPSVAEGFRQAAAGLNELHGQADDLKRTFEQVHEAELKRIDDPRPGEEIWDVGNNDTGRAG